MNRIIGFFINQNKVINLIVMLILLGGLYSFKNTKKESFPNIQALVINITTFYPGGSPEDIEKLITRKIEDVITNVDGKKQISSISEESKSKIVFEIDPKTNLTVTEIRQELQNQINRILSDLPEDASDPIVESVSFDELPVLSVFFSGPNEDSLQKYVNIFEEKAKRLTGIGQALKDGYREKEIQVLGNYKKLAQQNLTLKDLYDAIQKYNINIPAGKTTINQEDHFVRIANEYQNLTQIENTIVRSNDYGKSILIKDVAKVTWAYQDAIVYHRKNSNNGIFLHIIKKSSGDIINLADDTYALVREFKQQVPSIIEIDVVNDLSYWVKRRLNVLTGNATIGLILVFLCLILFFDLRTTFWTTMGIPISFGASLIITSWMGLSINMMTMFGFIIVIGMIVDDAVVVGENIYRFKEKGHSSLKASILGTADVFKPIVAAVSTTCVAFLPLLTLPDIWGDFLGTLAIVTITTMIASLFECIFILPSHLSHKKKKNKVERKWFKVLQQKYYQALTFLLKRPTINFILLVFICFFSVAILFKTKLVTFVLFPDAVEEIQFVVQGKNKNTLKDTERILDQIEKGLLPLGHLYRDYFSSVGIKLAQEGSIQFGTNLGYTKIFLKPNLNLSTQEILSQLEPIQQKILKENQNQLVDLRLAKASAGPGEENPISVDLFNNQYSKTIKLSSQLEKFIKSLPNTTSVQNSYEEGKKEILFEVNDSLAAAYGIYVNNLAQNIAYAIDGGKASSTSSLLGEDDEIDIIITYPKSKILTLADIENLTIPNRFEKSIQLKEFCKVNVQSSFKNIKRKESKRQITISAQIKNPEDPLYNSETLNNKIEQYLKQELIPQFPNSRFELEGSRKENEKLLKAVFIALILAVFGILIILVSLFKNYTQAIIVISIIPFAFTGLVWGLFINQVPIGLMPFLGMLTLTGVIVNDSLILVKFINDELHKNPANPLQAIAKGSKTRLRPIMITSMTTLCGLLPLAYGILGNEPFLAPMAIALLWGLFFSSILVVFVIPLIYAIHNKITTKLSNLLSFKKV